MKNYIVIAGAVFLLALCTLFAKSTSPKIDSTRPSAEWPDSDNQLAITLLDSLQVGEIDLRLAQDSEVARKQLWDLYANSELSDRYAQIEVPGGTSVWPVFRDRLIAAVRAKKVDSESLERALSKIEQQEPGLTTKGQLFPFGAFVARRGKEKVWVIPCQWESGYRPPVDGRPIPMKAGHIRVWAFSIESGRQVGFTTCK